MYYNTLLYLFFSNQPPSGFSCLIFAGFNIFFSFLFLIPARNLKQPFIKFEALNKFFRPVQMELNSWPYLNMNSTQGSCPFDDWLLGVSAVNSSAQEATKRKNKQDVGGCWSAESEGQGDAPSRLQKVKKKR